jgi:glutamate-1-semialdehyde aminotransferase
MSKLEYLDDDKFIDYCFENGNFEEGHKHNPNFEIIEIEKIGDDSL